MFESDVGTQPSGGNGHSVGTEQFRATWQQTRSQLHGFDERAREFARERPLAALAGAVLAGYVIGRLVARV